MAFDFVRENICHLWDNVAEGVSGLTQYTSDMDIAAYLFCFAIIISALIIYVAFAYTSKELTYEEAMEKQKRLAEEARDQGKHDRKDKKQMKKKPKEKEDEKVSLVEKAQFDDGSPLAQNLSNIPESNIKKKNKKAKTEKIRLQLSVSDDIPEPCECSDVPEEKNGDEAFPTLIISTEVDESLSTSLQDDTSEPIQLVAEIPQTPPSSTKKKSKNTALSDDSMDAEISNAKVLSFLKSAVMNEEELQELMDIFSNKESCFGHWKKKNDPIPGLKRHLQEKDEALEQKQHLLNSTNERLKNARQELTLEKSKFSKTEKTLKEKVSQMSHQIQTLHAKLNKHANCLTLDQHSAEIQQIKLKHKEEYNHAIKRLNEEIQRKHDMMIFEKENRELRQQLVDTRRLLKESNGELREHIQVRNELAKRLKKSQWEISELKKDNMVLQYKKADLTMKLFSIESNLAGNDGEKSNNCEKMSCSDRDELFTQAQRTLKNLFPYVTVSSDLAGEAWLKKFELEAECFSEKQNANTSKTFSDLNFVSESLKKQIAENTNLKEVIEQYKNLANTMLNRLNTIQECVENVFLEEDVTVLAKPHNADTDRDRNFNIKEEESIKTSKKDSTVNDGSCDEMLSLSGDNCNIMAKSEKKKKSKKKGARKT